MSRLRTVGESGWLFRNCSHELLSSPFSLNPSMNTRITIFFSYLVFSISHPDVALIYLQNFDVIKPLSNCAVSLIYLKKNSGVLLGYLT